MLPIKLSLVELQLKLFIFNLHIVYLPYPTI